ncbi:MAG: HEAT repeat domain-containing protein [Verrucomicrobiota bacterium]
MFLRPLPLLAAGVLAVSVAGTKAETPGGDQPLRWVGDFEQAAVLAAGEYRPIVLVFSSPHCAWCKRLRSETLDDPMLKGLLGQYVLAEIDVTEDAATAMRFRVRGTPTTLILGSDGVPVDAFGGFISADDLRKRLNLGLNRQSDALTPESEQWLETLRGGDLSAAQWAAMIAGLSRQADKGALMRAVTDLDPMPKSVWVGLLGHPNLAVRAGVLDILERITGETHGYDPWQDDAIANTQALLRWRQWARGAETTPVGKLKLSPEEIRGVFADLVSEDQARASRARVLLKQAGPEWLPVLEEAWAAAEDLPPGARKRLQEARYYLLLSGLPAGNTERLTSGLVYGNLDLQMQSLTGMAVYGRVAVPIFAEHLASPKAVVRETAIDGLLRTGRRGVVGIVAKHLEDEPDENVTFVALRALGEVNSRKGLELLTGYLDHDNEDLVIAALRSIARLESREPAADIASCLQDPRWRVRVAALETAAKLKLNSLEDQVVALLDDEDDFVRTLAVRKVAEMHLRSSLAQLTKAYFAEDSLKPAVIDAYASLDAPLPGRVKKDLLEQSPEVQLSALQVLQNHSDVDASLAVDLLESPNPDVRMAAVRLLAANGLDQPAGRAAMLGVLRGGTEGERTAALEAMRVDGEDLLGRDPASGWADGLLRAAPASAALSSTTGATSADVIAGFNEAHAAAGLRVTSNDDLREFLLELRDMTGPGQPGRVRLAAGRVLTRLGASGALPYLSANLDALTVSELRRLVRDLDHVPPGSARPMLTDLLDHADSNVRESAAETLFEQNDPAALDTVLEALTSLDGRLQPNEIFGYRLAYLLRDGRMRTRFGEWVRAILAEPTVKPSVQRFALALTPLTWQKGDEELLAPFLASDDVWTRREAIRALGSGNREAFEARADELRRSPHASVRETVVRNYSVDDDDWMWKHRFDPASPVSGISRYHRMHEHNRRKPGLSKQGEEILTELTRDPVASVRYQAYLALMHARRPVDIRGFMETATELPDQKTVGRAVSKFLENNQGRLGPEYAPLAIFLQHGWQSEGVKERIRRRLSVAQDTEESVAGDELLAVANEAPARFQPPVTTAEPENPELVRLVYFASAGCRECELAEEKLEELKASFPAIEIEKHDIRDISSMRYNEALSSRFGVPHKLRQVTPAVFAAAGYLAKDDVNLRNLGELIQQSQGTPLELWHDVTAPAMAQAETAISERFQSFTLGVVLGAGLLDGLNPCAFATIIFFLSYLQMSRRPRHQIAQVGIAFVAAVFLSYFILGLGLVEIIARIEALRTIGLAFNYLVAAIALVIMVVSLRDGVLALQGRLRDMNLQLPSFLKERVRQVSRKGARHAHFVVAAFVSGAIISVLELACTGQVYLPTIMYMVKSGEHRWDAVFYLLMYNLAFILPLVIIFIAATFGLRHEALIKWQAKHTASVKFATAGLFLVLFAFLVLQTQLI